MSDDLAGPKVRGAAKRILQYLTDLAEVGGPTPTAIQIGSAPTTRASEATVDRAIRLLIQNGDITVQRYGSAYRSITLTATGKRTVHPSEARHREIIATRGDDILAAYREGKQAWAIARRLRIPLEAVRQVLAENGIDKVRRVIAPRPYSEYVMETKPKPLDEWPANATFDDCPIAKRADRHGLPIFGFSQVARYTRGVGDHRSYVGCSAAVAAI